MKQPKNWDDCIKSSEQTGIPLMEIANIHGIENPELTSLKQLLEIALNKNDIPTLFSISKNKLSTGRIKIDALRSVFKHAKNYGQIRLMKWVHDRKVYPLRLKEKIYHASEKELTLRLNQAKLNPIYDKLWLLHKLTFYRSQVEDKILTEIISLALKEKKISVLWEVYKKTDNGFHSESKAPCLDAIVNVAKENRDVDQMIEVYHAACVIDYVKKSALEGIEKWANDEFLKATESEDIKLAKEIREKLSEMEGLILDSREIINKIIISKFSEVKKKPTFDKLWELHWQTFYKSDLQKEIDSEILRYADSKKNMNQLFKVRSDSEFGFIKIKARNAILRIAISKKDFDLMWKVIPYGFGIRSLEILEQILETAIEVDDIENIKKCYEYHNNNNPKEGAKIVKDRALRKIIELT